MEKATISEKIGYGVASLGDSISYGFVSTFFLFFLTTIANIPPAIAGAIVGIGSIWNALFNPIMGYFADKVNTRFGRRRPVILFFSVFLGLTLFLLFTNVSLPMSVKPVYYGLMVVFFWSSFTGFFVPYSALGVDYAADYDERTSIRSFASFFNMTGNLLCMATPTMIVAFLQQHGFSASGAWSATGGFLGTITFASIIITVIASKGKDIPLKKEGKSSEERPKEKHVIINIFKEYISIARLRPMKYLIAASLFSLIVYIMIMSDMIYYLTYNKGLTAMQISGCLIARSLLGIAFIPIVGKLCTRFDKRIALITCYTISMIGLILTKFTDIQWLLGSAIYVLSITLCTAIYWQVMPSVYYDMCEYDNNVSGKRREATILSFQGLVEAVAVGIGGQLLGMILQISNFNGNAAVQTATAMQWIENSTTIIPIIFLVVAAFALYKFPLSRHTLKKLKSKSKN